MAAVKKAEVVDKKDEEKKERTPTIRFSTMRPIPVRKVRSA